MGWRARASGVWEAGGGLDNGGQTVTSSEMLPNGRKNGNQALEPTDPIPRQDVDLSKGRAPTLWGPARETSVTRGPLLGQDVDLQRDREPTAVCTSQGSQVTSGRKYGDKGPNASRDASKM